jgi:osmotically-inducible protein OsmY
MGLRHRKTPTSYDEIVRGTVPGPGLSYPPSHDEEQASRHRFGEGTEHRPHTLSSHERDLRDRVRDALAADPALDLSDVTVDVDGSEIVLVGSVPGPATAIRIEEIVAAISGVYGVDNQLAVRGRRR